MSTMTLGVPGPFPSNSAFPGLSEDEFLNLRSLDEMTRQELDDLLVGAFGLESPDSSNYPYGPSNAAPSPGRQGLAQGLAETSSRSADTASLILTPSSASLLEYHGDAVPLIDDPEASDSMSIAPETTFSTSEGYVHVNQTDGRQDLNSQFPGSGAHLSPTYYSHQSVAALMPCSQAAFPSCNTPTSTDTWIGQPQVHAQAAATQFDSLQLPVTRSFNEDEVIAHAIPFDATLYYLEPSATALASDFNSWGSLRTDELGDGRALPQTSLDALNIPIPDIRLTNLSQGHRGSGFTSIQQSQAIPEPEGPTSQVHHGRLGPQGQHVTTGLMRNQDTSPAGTPTHPRRVERQRSSGSDSTALPNRRLEPRRAESSQTMEHAQKQRKSKGGRSKNMRLPPAARDKSHKMRSIGACWGCIFQRDTCPDEGTPCRRCLDKATKGRIMYFPCDRSKLTELRHDFLPTSFTSCHQKQPLLDQVGKEVAQWDEQNGIDVYLTSAYGPALRWKVYEFVPRDRQHLIQYQYLQDVQTGHVHRYEKYSPPFGLTKLDSSDEHHFETYLDRLMHPNFLWNFGWIFYAEEDEIDDFLPRLVEMLCNLYQQTLDADLQQILHKIIRLMMITYIMGHTLTISEDTLFGVFDSIRHSPKPRNVSRRTSPRLASRQLKFFFACMREQVYGNILNWTQQTLHSSKEKSETWLPAFCVMLGFAMVLEEVQRTVHLQADTSIIKGVKSVEEATTEAVNACGRIDERYTLLVGLYQCKYRDRKWNDSGSFGPSTPRLEEPCQHHFLIRLHMMVREKAEYLQSRKDVPLGHENQTKYTSRLVARFLLPFLGLP
ncbi:hypothetical protein EJ03DRAFT_353055 [Teratosphaeria nubilosa]|uniref:Uncharacterized protein n=1 Tax=Teratosphaeria nubilosa TaxID=161662 RepID=A0A6G1L4B6_9PEZI|nr:hypothetical protein EJ03DRAFT_353055 [Teratosphaeria nubilosa]